MFLKDPASEPYRETYKGNFKLFKITLRQILREKFTPQAFVN